MNLNELENLSDEELYDLIEKAKSILSKRRTKWFHFKTDGCFTPKFGPAYVAKLYLSGDEIEREFIVSNGKEWCKKQKSYKEDWDVELNNFDVIEARLKTGRKFDEREWYVFKDGELEKLADLDEARAVLKNLK